MLAQVVAPMVTGAATYSDELQGAYDYAYSQGITTMSSIDNANMYWDLTRGQLSKMISQWAEKEMGVAVDETAVCSFTDTDKAEGDLGTYVVKACKMGLMGQGIEKFRPGDKVTRGEFGTVLSRAIWGDKYNSENPFYAKHLQALKDAGIMNNISDPNATEMRGWVMLMLQRAAENVNPSECNDPAVLLACSLGSDSCPAACIKNNDEKTVDEDGNPIVVKSGDLSISATATEGKKVILNGGTSELDVITFKASESITLNSITLERYGFSSYKDVANIWLENANGVKIANEKSISSSKDTVTLNLKKDYKTIENGDTITVVIETNKFDNTYTSTGAGTSIGFKVTSVDSSAKNLDITNYSPYLYDMITYNGSTVTVTVKGKDTKYHYDNNKSYEVARFQVKAGNAAVNVNWFTLTDNGSMDIDKYIDSIKVSLNDGTELKNVRSEINKDEEIKVSFDDVEIGINKNVIFVVEAVLNDLDKYNSTVVLWFAKPSDLNVQEAKNSTRATVELWATAATNLDLHTYTFQGGKIEVSNEKLSDTIDAAAWASDIVIGKGKITLAGDSIELNGLFVGVDSSVSTADGIIETFKMVVNGEEFDGTWNSAKTGYDFWKINIDRSWTIEFVVDLKDDNNNTYKWAKLTVKNWFDKTNIVKKTLYSEANALGKYEEARQAITSEDWAGSISLSNIKIQAAKGSLSNNQKDVEFLSKQTSRKTIFDGTYTATKWDLYLSEFAVRLDWATMPSAGNEVTFYLSIDGKEVGSFEYTPGRNEWSSWDEAFLIAYPESFTNIFVKGWDKVSVKLEANVNSSTDVTETYSPVLILRWEDKDGNPAGLASEFAGKIKIVSAGSVTVSESVVTPKESVEVNDTNVTLARFTVKSSKGTEGMTLQNFTLSGTSTDKITDKSQIRIRVNWTEVDSDNITVNAASWDIIVTDLSEDIPSAWVDVEVVKKAELAGTTATYRFTLTNVNGSNPGTKFSKMVIKSVASIKAQENRGDSTTKFTFAVDKDSSSEAVQNLVLYTKTTGGYVPLNEALSTVEEWTTLEITNASSVQFIDAIAWGATIVPSDVTTSTLTGDVVITKTDFRDFFKVGNADAQVFRTK